MASDKPAAAAAAVVAETDSVAADATFAFGKDQVQECRVQTHEG